MKLLRREFRFLLSSDFEDAMVRALRMGGDADTIAAMTGALAGLDTAIDGFLSCGIRWRGGIV